MRAFVAAHTFVAHIRELGSATRTCYAVRMSENAKELGLRPEKAKTEEQVRAELFLLASEMIAKARSAPNSTAAIDFTKAAVEAFDAASAKQIDVPPDGGRVPNDVPPDRGRDAQRAPIDVPPDGG